MNRAELFTEVMADLNREDKADRLPGWLESAEFLINENLRDERMVKHAVLPITETEFPFPPDMQAPKGNISVRSGSDPANPGPVLASLYYMPSDEIDNGLGNPAYFELPRGPLWYTVRGRNVILGGWTKPGPFLADLWYYGDLMKLENDTDENWLSKIAGHIYKNLMLAFGFRHLQEFDTADRFQMQAMGEIQAINDRNEAKKYGDGPLIKRPVQGFGQNRFRRR